MNGLLRERPLAELIREINAAKLSGALRLARERVQAVVYAEAGEIVFARSNLRVHRLAAGLLRWGVLSESQLSAHVTEFMSDTEAGAALVAAGAIDKDTLSKLHARQAADVLRPLLLWTDGEWSFDPRARLVEDVRCKLDVRQMLLEAARQLPAEYVAARLADESETISPVNAPPAQIQLQPLEGFVLSRVEAPLALGELLAISGLPEAQARQSVYALALGGLVARSAWPVSLGAAASAANVAANVAAKANADAAQQVTSTPKVEAPEDAAAAKKDATPDPRAEIDALFAHVRDRDNYQILGLERTAAPAEIKRAYYALAKRFHPDRFQRDADASLRTQIEAAFMKITQAYETLGDARSRSAYDLKLGTQTGAPASSQTSGRASEGTDTHLTREQRAAEKFTQGVAALRQSNLGSAVTLLGEAARLAPQQSRYHAFYGSALARDVRTRHQAEAALQTAIKLDGNDPVYRVMLAELLRALGHTLRAERELERALALDPKHEAARRQLDQLRRMKKSDK
ncbi:MAG TPA: DnaJ domain-containing protein [Pyrinomonadaceae bacterium]|nr:DnaJ domain-containing protein [Pyrinomonadaceae bacterium]